MHSVQKTGKWAEISPENWTGRIHLAQAVGTEARSDAVRLDGVLSEVDTVSLWSYLERNQGEEDRIDILEALDEYADVQGITRAEALHRASEGLVG